MATTKESPLSPPPTKRARKETTVEEEGVGRVPTKHNYNVADFLPFTRTPFERTYVFTVYSAHGTRWFDDIVAEMMVDPDAWDEETRFALWVTCEVGVPMEKPKDSTLRQCHETLYWDMLETATELAEQEGVEWADHLAHFLNARHRGASMEQELHPLCECEDCEVLRHSDACQLVVGIVGDNHIKQTWPLVCEARDVFDEMQETGNVLVRLDPGDHVVTLEAEVYACGVAFAFFVLFYLMDAQRAGRLDVKALGAVDRAALVGWFLGERPTQPTPFSHLYGKLQLAETGLTGLLPTLRVGAAPAASPALLLALAHEDFTDYYFVERGLTPDHLEYVRRLSEARDETDADRPNTHWRGMDWRRLGWHVKHVFCGAEADEETPTLVLPACVTSTAWRRPFQHSLPGPVLVYHCSLAD